MIAIPNMDMPETCDMCPIEGCEYISGKFTCPIIEIVQCKECINWNVENGVCNQWSDSHEFDIRETDPDDFCSYGERRSK